jgi:hypothetical protein
LPKEVLEDLCLREGDIKSSPAILPTSTPAQDDVSLESGEPKETEQGAAGPATGPSQSVGGDEESRDDPSLSLAVTVASLPWSTKSVPLGVVQESSAEVVQGMWTSLDACAALPVLSDGGKKPMEGTIALPSQAQLLRDGSTIRDRLSSQECVDGLVLVWASSRATSRVHCIDVTVRCNPPLSKRSGDSNDTSTTGNSNMLVSQEDLDGWRGYFAPFAYIRHVLASSTVPTGTANTSNLANVAAGDDGRGDHDDRIIGMAACRVPPEARARPPAISAPVIHVACASSNQLCVWEDPHLYLSCRRPLALPSASSPPLPTSARIFHLREGNGTDGKYATVDIAPGVVVVGSDTGVVVIYTYNTISGASSSHPGALPGGSMPGPTFGSLKRYLRIPAPLAGNVEVVSVRIAVQPEYATDKTKNQSSKASVFVVYRRKASLSNDPSSALQPGNSSSGSSPLSGISCFDFNLPSMGSSVTASGPSARHDLDSRFVGSARLVDSFYSESHGLQLTVVSIVFRMFAYLLLYF